MHSFSQNDGLAIQRACPRLTECVFNVHSDIDPAQLSGLQISNLRKLTDNEVPAILNAISRPFLDLLASSSPSPHIEEVTIFLPLNDVPPPWVNGCSSFHVMFHENDLPDSEVLMLQNWHAIRHLSISSVQPIMIALGLDRMRQQLVSLEVERLTRSDLEVLFHSSSSASSSSWPRLQKLHDTSIYSSECGADALETVVSCCPALTDLNVGVLSRLPVDPLLPNACGLSEQSLDSLAAHLLTLTLKSAGPREMDLLEKLALRSAHITDLRFKSDSSYSDLAPFSTPLPRLQHLSFRNCSSRLMADVVERLAGLPAASVRELHSLNFNVCSPDAFPWVGCSDCVSGHQQANAGSPAYRVW